MLERFLTHLQTHGWSLRRNAAPGPGLPEIFEKRYRRCPEDWLRFLAAVRSLVRADEGAWFLCAEDYALQTSGAFRWDEWEHLSLAAAGDDQAWAREIRAFWDGHLPILLSVSGGYAYYALSMEDGSVVHGAEPEFETCQLAAKSFGDFMEQVLRGRISLHSI